ncbi:hypothetical protein HK096_006690 [Nowakowskiella sp. JEL0078]|nr:hypothetical protein HK096_006690 [Nowakowskiella sp. JEL0078]
MPRSNSFRKIYQYQGPSGPPSPISEDSDQTFNNYGPHSPNPFPGRNPRPRSTSLTSVPSNFSNLPNSSRLSGGQDINLYPPIVNNFSTSAEEVAGGYFPPQRRISNKKKTTPKPSTVVGVVFSEKEIQPEESLSLPLLRSPLYSADVLLVMIPHLIDSLPRKVPDDSWIWESKIISAETAEIKREKRYYVICHMLETEQHYFEDLKLIIKDLILFQFRKRLLDKGIMNSVSSEIAFKGIDELLNTQTTFLKQMESAVFQGEQTSVSMSLVGKLFLNNVQFSLSQIFKLYFYSKPES